MYNIQVTVITTVHYIGGTDTGVYDQLTGTCLVNQLELLRPDSHRQELNCTTTNLVTTKNKVHWRVPATAVCTIFELHGYEGTWYTFLCMLRRQSVLMHAFNMVAMAGTPVSKGIHTFTCAQL